MTIRGEYFIAESQGELIGETQNAFVEVVRARSRHMGSWITEAACRGMDSNFFHPQGKGIGAWRASERAKQVCEDCVVIVECRDYALNNHEQLGVWGGMSEEERRSYHRQQRQVIRRTSG